jgi:hypothetical protein
MKFCRYGERHRSPRGEKTNDVPNRLIAAGVHRIVPHSLLVDDGKCFSDLCQMFSMTANTTIVRAVEHVYRPRN